jgi:hypothetical protein
MSKRKLTRDEITLTFEKDKQGRLVVVAGIYEENGWRSYEKFFLNELPNEKVTADDLASVGIEESPVSEAGDEGYGKVGTYLLGGSKSI